MRFIAGVSSSAGVILGSGLILNWLIRHQYRSELGIHFSGIGLGIALTAFMVNQFSSYLDWREQWLALSLVGAVLAIPSWRWLPRPVNAHLMQNGETLVDHPPSPLYLRLFIPIYFFAGVGYVVSATFIVAIVEQQMVAMGQAPGQGTYVFLILGLAAAPACMIWDFVARRWGDLNALIAAFFLHTIGVLLPIFDHSLPSAFISAALFGATFIGIVSLVLSIAGRLYPTRPAKMMGKMTILYGVAQIVVPGITGRIAEMGGSYRDGLYMAGGAMILGTVLLFVLKIVEKKEAVQTRDGTDHVVGNQTRGQEAV